jgi:amino acid transporter
MIVSFYIANTIEQFSHYVPSSGGYYTFVSRGLGPRFGFMTTWCYLIYDILGPTGAVGFLGIHLKPEVLPFSNIPAYLPPFWLSPQQAMRVS